MKKYILLPAILFCIALGNVGAQNEALASKKVSNTEQTKVDALLESKDFEFVANTVLPLGQPPKNLVGSDYSVTFSPEMIVGNMPYYGRAYRTLIGRDKGMRFKGAPKNFSVDKKDKGFEINTTVEGENETYALLLTVSNSGFATLSITTNNRYTINYQGEIKGR